MQRFPGYVLSLALMCAACSPPPRDFRYEFFALGTDVSLTFYAVEREQAQNAAAMLESHYRTTGQHWYPWVAGELQSVNVAIGNGDSIVVSTRLGEVIRRAAEIEAASGGRFNSGLGHLTEMWGLNDINSAPDTAPAPADIAALLAQKPGARRLQWDGDRVSSESTSVKIDLGGIAKGALLADGVAFLETLGIHDAIINLGGDLTVIGSVHERRARVGIRSPHSDEAIAYLDAADGETVVTSGNYERFVEIGGHRYTHILDPASGFPVTHTASVTVVHEDAPLADAAATALMVGGAAEFDALCEALDIEYALLIDASGDIRLTGGMRDRLHSIASKPLFDRQK